MLKIYDEDTLLELVNLSASHSSSGNLESSVNLIGWQAVD